MKILICTGIYPPDIGGPATYSVNLAKELRKLGNEVSVVTYSNKKEINKEDGVYRVKRRKNILLRYLGYFKSVLGLCDGVDIVYILDLMSAGFPATMVAKMRGKKVVFRTGGDFLWEKSFQRGWTELYLTDYYNSPKNFLEKAMMNFSKWILKKIDLIIFSTETQFSIYKKYYDVAESRGKVVSNALPQVDVNISGVNDENLIIFAGRLIKLKNISRLIDAFNEVNNKDIKMLIFGEGPEKKNIEYRIKNYGLENKIKIAGNAGRKELLEKIKGCRFVVIPSIYEISSNLALECLGIKKPFLLTKNTGLNNDIINGVITVDPFSTEDIKKKIDYLMDDNNLFEYAKKLEDVRLLGRLWKDVAEDHLVIFKKLL